MRPLCSCFVCYWVVMVDIHARFRAIFGVGELLTTPDHHKNTCRPPTITTQPPTHAHTTLLYDDEGSCVPLAFLGCGVLGVALQRTFNGLCHFEIFRAAGVLHAARGSRGTAISDDTFSARVLFELGSEVAEPFNAAWNPVFMQLWGRIEEARLCGSVRSPSDMAMAVMMMLVEFYVRGGVISNLGTVIGGHEDLPAPFAAKGLGI